MYQSDQYERNDRMTRRAKWVLIGFLLVALFFLLTEHRAHLFGVLPYFLLLACPLMHLFHGHHGHRAANADQQHSSATGSSDTGEDREP